MGIDDDEKVNREDGDRPSGGSFDHHECSCNPGDSSDGQGDDSDSEYNEEGIVHDIRYSSPSRYDREYRKTYGRKYAQINVYT